MATNDAQHAAIDALAKIPVDQPATIADVIDWIETELDDEGNFRDIPAILADARERFVRESVPGPIVRKSVQQVAQI